MKQYATLIALWATTVCPEQASGTAQIASNQPRVEASASSSMRQLSAKEAAELRQLLYQYSHSRLPVKAN